MEEEDEGGEHGNHVKCQSQSRSTNVGVGHVGAVPTDGAGPSRWGDASREASPRQRSWLGPQTCQVAHPLSFRAWKQFLAMDRGGDIGRTETMSGSQKTNGGTRQDPENDKFDGVDWGVGVTWLMLERELDVMPTLVDLEKNEEGEVREINLDVEKAACKLGRLQKTGVVMQALESSPSRDRVTAWVRETMVMRAGVSVSQITALDRPEFLIVFTSEEEKRHILGRPPRFLDGRLIRLVEWEDRHRLKLATNLRAAWVELRGIPPFLEDQAESMLEAVGPVVYATTDKESALRYTNVRGCIVLDLGLDLPKTGQQADKHGPVAGPISNPQPRGNDGDGLVNSKPQSTDPEGFIPVRSRSGSKKSLGSASPQFSSEPGTNRFHVLSTQTDHEDEESVTSGMIVSDHDDLAEEEELPGDCGKKSASEEVELPAGGLGQSQDAKTKALDAQVKVVNDPVLTAPSLNWEIEPTPTAGHNQLNIEAQCTNQEMMVLKAEKTDDSLMDTEVEKLNDDPILNITLDNPFNSDFSLLAEGQRSGELGEGMPFTSNPKVLEHMGRSPKKREKSHFGSVRGKLKKLLGSSSNCLAQPVVNPLRDLTTRGFGKRRPLGVVDHNGCRLSSKVDNFLELEESRSRDRKDSGDGLRQVCQVLESMAKIAREEGSKENRGL
ncbi:hypothetical protein R1sor_003031 [Riccia sorocarpa]|uniref:DUF4283 domain-containing protein n=1 Tax=Riccia sorocarpa TaxID=122646 RepID=A0ABD3H6J9_9MARC